MSVPWCPCQTILLQVVARICNFKVPEEQRRDQPFELTLQSWLALFFLPAYRKLLKEKNNLCSTAKKLT